MTAGLVVLACAAVAGLGGTNAAATADDAARATAAPVVDLLEGRADARVEITPDGRHAIVHQGSGYDPESLLKVDLTAVPAQVVGQVPVPADSSSDLALVDGSFAWTTDDRDLWVSDVRAAQPRVIGRFGVRVDGDRATLFDVASHPKRPLGYATADDWIHEPGSTLVVLKARKNGRPVQVRSVKVRATHLAVSRDGKRLAAAAGTKVHLFDLRNPAAPRRLGRPVKIKGDARAVSFGKTSKDLYVVTAGRTLSVTRVHTGKRKVVRSAALVRGSSSSVSGDVAVSADGKRLVVVTDGADRENVSVLVLDPRLRVVGSTIGPCYPDSVTSSLAGVTRGQFFVADSGICERARLWHVAP